MHFFSHETKGPDRQAWMLIIFASTLPHLPYIWSYFFMDDFWHLAYLARGDYIFSTWRVGREAIDQLWYMSREVFPQMAWVEYIQYYFRPIYLIFVQIDRALFDFWAPGYHIQSQLWHSANACLLFVLLRKLSMSRGLALLAAITFGLHPMAAEPLGWVSARCDLHVVAFLLLSTLAYLKYREGGGIRYLVLHLLLFLAALGSQEHAIAFPFVLAATEIFRMLFSEQRTEKPFRFDWLPAMALATAFLAWRLLDHGGEDTWSMSQTNFFSFKLYGPLGVLGQGLVQYAKLAAFGIPPSSYTGNTPPLTGWTGWPLFIASMILILFWLWKFRRQPLLLLWFWAFGMLFAMLWIPFSGRYFYPAAPGFAVLFALGVGNLAASGRPWRKMASKGLTLTLLLFWFSVSLIISTSGLLSHRSVEKSLNRIVEEVKARPEVTDLYLMHIWPLMVSSPGILPLLADRPDLRVHLLTYASTLYNPDLYGSMKKMAGLVYPIDGRWFEPMEITNLRVTDQALVLTSKPAGFFAGPATFGWNSQQLPRPPKGVVHLKQFDVRFGKAAHMGGVQSLMFKLHQPLDHPSKLWMEWREGGMQVWIPPKL